MKRWYALLVLCVMAGNGQADDINDECLQSMQKVYKFYYHEIVPKNDAQAPEILGSKEAQEMETVIGKLKSTCPAEVIAKMNLYLQAESGQG